MNLRLIFNEKPQFGNEIHISEVQRRLDVFSSRKIISTRTIHMQCEYEWCPDTFRCPLCKTYHVIGFDDESFGCENELCPVVFEVVEISDRLAHLYVMTDKRNYYPWD
jgi:hypothetical protein